MQLHEYTYARKHPFTPMRARAHIHTQVEYTFTTRNHLRNQLGLCVCGKQTNKQKTRSKQTKTLQLFDNCNYVLNVRRLSTEITL